MNKELLEKILSDAVHAPSGENTQPWRFEVVADYSTLHLCSIPGRDDSIFNLNNRSMFVAFGALIENISLLSLSYGFESVVTIPEEEKKERGYIASIFFKKIDYSEDNLIEYIKDRHSNREAYQEVVISEAVLSMITANSGINSMTTVHAVTDKKAIGILGKILSVNDFLVVHNKYLHFSLFSNLIWNKSDLRYRKTGFYLPTLGLDFVSYIGTYFVRFWLICYISRLFLFPWYVAWKSAQKIRTASLIGCIGVHTDTKESFIESGRVLQKTWLRLTKEGYSVQVFGIPLLHRALNSPYADVFDSLERKKITEMYTVITDVYNLKEEIPVVLFRVGKTMQDVPRAKKMKPQITYL